MNGRPWAGWIIPSLMIFAVGDKILLLVERDLFPIFIEEAERRSLHAGLK